MHSISSADNNVKNFKAKRSHSAQGFVASCPNSAMKIPMPPRLWITGLYYYATNICIQCTHFSQVKIHIIFIHELSVYKLQVNDKKIMLLDVEDESSDEMSGSVRDDGVPVERTRVRSRFRHQKQRTSVSVPVGIFWDIENCQVRIE